MKKIALITVLGAIALTIIAYPIPLAAADPSANLVGANSETQYIYNVSGDSFTNQPVKSQRLFTTQFINITDSTALPVSGVSLTLDSPTKYDSLGGYLSQVGGERQLPSLSGPPEYQWSFGNIPDSYGARGIVGTSNDEFDITPGFDASRVADSTHFTQSGTQTLTVTVTAREAVQNIDINVNLPEDKYVNPTLDSMKTDINQGLYVSLDGHGLSKQIKNPIVGVPYTYQIKINVLLKPGVPEVDFMPLTTVDSVQITQTVGGTILSSLSHTMPGVGTWTWSTAGSCTWAGWEERISNALYFPAYSKVSEDSFIAEDIFTAAVPLPDQVSTDPKVIGISVFLASLLVVIFYFAATLFNSTFKENYETIQNWARRLSAFFSMKRRKSSSQPPHPSKVLQFLEIIVIVLVTAVINSALDPGIGFNDRGIIIFTAMIGAAVVSTYSYNGVRVLITKYRYHIPATVKAYPLAIILAIIFVVVSRLVRFHPGFIFGFVGAFTILPSPITPDKRKRSIGIVAGAIIVILLALLAFMLRQPLSSTPASFWHSMLDTVLAGLFVGGLQRLLFGLMPLTFLDGGTLVSWKKLLWFLLFGVIVFLFIQIVVNKTDSLIHAVKDMNVITVVSLALGSLVFSALFWLYFRIRAKART